MPDGNAKGRNMGGRKRTLRPAGTAPPGARLRNFRQRYDDLEHARMALLARLERHMKIARTHPSAKRAQKLLNDTFRSASVAQRAAILQAAEWLISLIEMTPPML
jgi:hypothetical protein